MFKRLREPTFLASVRSQGAHFHQRLQDLATRYPALIHSVRGVGLILGIQLHAGHATADFVDAARERGVLMVGAGLNVIRVLPPLIITRGEVDEACAVLERVCAHLVSRKEGAGQ